MAYKSKMPRALQSGNMCESSGAPVPLAKLPLRCARLQELAEHKDPQGKLNNRDRPSDKNLAVLVLKKVPSE